MTMIKRYDMEIAYTDTEGADVVVPVAGENGDWVKWEDVLTDRQNLRHDMNFLGNQFDRLWKAHNLLCSRGNGNE